MDTSTSAVLSAFSMVLSSHSGDRQLAEQQLNLLEALDTYPITLVDLLANSNLDIGIRQLSGLTLNRYVSVHWDQAECETFKPPQATDKAKAHVRTILIQLLGDPIRLLRTTVARVIATIAEFDWPETWHNLLAELVLPLTNTFQSGDQDGVCAKNLTHSVMKVLSGICDNISDLDVPHIAPTLMPCLMRVFAAKQSFGVTTRCSAIRVVEKLTGAMILDAKSETFDTYIGNYIRPYIDCILEGIADPCKSVKESALGRELLVLLTNLCMDVPFFVKNYIDGGPSRVLHAFFALAVQCTNAYVQLEFERSQQDEADDVLEDDVNDIVDSDGESVELDTLLYCMHVSLGRFCQVKRFRKHLEKCLPDITYHLARSMILPKQTIRRWTLSVAEYMEDTKDGMGYSVRMSVMETLSSLSGDFPNWSSVLHCVLLKLFATAESEHNTGNPDWWKSLDVALHLAGQFAKDIYQPNFGTAPPAEYVSVELLYTRYIMHSLQQINLPFLQASALYCVIQLAVVDGNTVCAKLEDLPNLLIEALSPTQHVIVRATAIRYLDDATCYLKERFCSGTSVPDSSLQTRLPSLVSGLADALTCIGEPVLDCGLFALGSLLRLDPHGFTSNTQIQISAFLVDLFKHCYSVATTLAMYLNVIRVIQSAGRDNEPTDTVAQALIPTVLMCLEQEQTADCGIVEAALLVLSALIQGCVPSANRIVVDRVFPAVVHLAITIQDATIISASCQVLRCYVAFSSHRILEWQDDEGNNGLSYILHVTSRLLDPSGSLKWAAAVGPLVSAILLGFQTQLLDENVDLLLRGTLARLSTLPDIHKQSGDHSLGLNHDLTPAAVTSLTDKEDAWSAQKNLVFVFIIMYRLQPETVLNFLASVPDPMGQPVIDKILRLWCACQSFFFARFEIKWSVVALSSLLQHAISTQDLRLMQLMTNETVPNEQMGDEAAGGSIAARTRNRTAADQPALRTIEIPLLVKMYKLLLLQLKHQFEEDAAENEDDFEEEDEEEIEEEEEDEDQPGQEELTKTTSDIINRFHSGIDKTIGKMANVYHGNDLGFGDSNDDGRDDADDPVYTVTPEAVLCSRDPVMKINIKEHICAFFRDLSTHPFFNEFSRYHTHAELVTLRQAGVLPE